MPSSFYAYATGSLRSSNWAASGLVLIAGVAPPFVFPFFFRVHLDRTRGTARSRHGEIRSRKLPENELVSLTGNSNRKNNAGSWVTRDHDRSSAVSLHSSRWCARRINRTERAEFRTALSAMVLRKSPNIDLSRNMTSNWLEIERNAGRAGHTLRGSCCNLNQ